MGQINLKKRQQRIAYMDAELFLTSSEHYSQIGADEIIEYSSENSGIPKAQMASAFYALNQQIRQFLLNGHSLELPNLGFLYLSVNAKATETEEEAGAKAVTRVSVKFRQCKKLRELINSNVHLVNTLTEKEKESSDSQNDDDNGGSSLNPSEGGERCEVRGIGQIHETLVYTVAEISWCLLSDDTNNSASKLTV